jgi:hypothetical protein
MRPGTALHVVRDLPGDELDQPGMEKPTNLLPKFFFLGWRQARGQISFAAGDQLGPTCQLIGSQPEQATR